MMLASSRGRKWRSVWRRERTSEGVGVNGELGLGWSVFGEGGLGGRVGVEESWLGVVLRGSINIMH